MERRTVLRGFASAVALAPFVPLRVLAQARAFTAAELATLEAVAEVALPSAVSARDREMVVNRFAAWFVNYRVGADRGHSYGDSRLSAGAPALNTTRYPTQIAALEKAARDQGAASFAALAAPKRRVIVEAMLNDAPAVTRLSARPTGANVIGDLLGFYFSSPDAYNLAYKAQIDRDQCRGLPGSEKAPAPLAVK